MIIFLYGEDNFRSREKLEAIKKKFFEKNSSGSGLSLFDFEEKIQGINWLEIAGARDLFSPKKLAIIKNLISSSSAEFQKETLNFLNSKKEISEDKDVVVVFWERDKPKENNSLFRFLKSNSKSQEFSILDDKKLAKWISLRIKEINPKISISPRALEKLIAYASSDLFQVDNEIAKLVNFKDNIIEEKDVDLLVKARISSNIFETLDALSLGDKKKALELLHNQLKNGDDPFYILSMYVYQFRNLLKIGEYFEKGLRNQYEIAKLVKLHPFVVQKGTAQLRNYTLARLKDIFNKLEEIDIAVKTGKADILLALDKFVAGI